MGKIKRGEGGRKVSRSNERTEEERERGGDDRLEGRREERDYLSGSVLTLTMGNV